MISVKTTGPWKQLRQLLNGYERRLSYVEDRISLDLAKALLEKVKENSPSGKEYKQYIESLTVVRITGIGKKYMYAVVSDRDNVKLKDATSGGLLNKTVVYFYSRDEQDYGLAALLSSGNPWPAEMVPNGIPSKDVSVIHRTVNEGEVKWARENVSNLIREHKGEFRSYGIYFGASEKEEDNPGNLDSLPDFMSSAIRAEFGINASPSPHWRPAARWVMSNLLLILKDDKKIQLALKDNVFREHTLPPGGQHKKMNIRQFKKETSEFQSKVAGK